MLRKIYLKHEQKVIHKQLKGPTLGPRLKQTVVGNILPFLIFPKTLEWQVEIFNLKYQVKSSRNKIKYVFVNYVE